MRWGVDEPVVARRPIRATAGFTLVELLVGLTLMGLLAVMLFGGFRFGLRAWVRR